MNIVWLCNKLLMLLYCKTVWIKLSAKEINVNVNLSNTSLIFLLVASQISDV